MEKERKPKIVILMEGLLLGGIASLLFIFAMQCKSSKVPTVIDCDDCPPQYSPPPIPDTVYVEVTCYECLDSMRQKIMHEIDSITNLNDSIFERRESDLNSYAAKLDSLRNTRIYDNLIIHADSTKAARAEFDPNTGKPVLIFE